MLYINSRMVLISKQTPISGSQRDWRQLVERKHNANYCYQDILENGRHWKRLYYWFHPDEGRIHTRLAHSIWALPGIQQVQNRQEIQ